LRQTGYRAGALFGEAPCFVGAVGGDVVTDTPSSVIASPSKTC